MRVCDCYRQLEPIQLMVGECLGAKNKPRVDCVGDESRCLFYSDRRRKAKVKTNADLIRAMSDEELAEFMFTANGCPMWVSEYSCKEDKGCAGAKGACWLDWLRQEDEGWD